MKDILEQLMYRHARTIHRDGALCYTADGDELMGRAFKAIGWPDPRPVSGVVLFVEPEAAALETPEKAVLPAAKKRRG